MGRQLLGNLTAAQFLKQHWQRRPLHVEQAFEDFESPVSSSELLRLACREEVESRLVVSRGSTPPQLEFGPFERTALTRLPRSGWQLLVQDVEHFVPRAAALLEQFDFLPQWRVDDVMVSLAAPGGTVGPHADQYDVFLIQAAGRRRWQIAETFDPALQEHAALRVLAKFDAEQEWMLEPGDLLYLPPGVAHYGVGDEASMTVSIGFRAPDEKELACAFGQELMERIDGGRRFTDPERSATEDPGRLEASDLEQLHALLRGLLSATDAELTRFLGCVLTRPKPHLELESDGAEEAAELVSSLQRGRKLRRRRNRRFCHTTSAVGIDLFVDGKHLSVSARCEPWVVALSKGETFDGRLLGGTVNDLNALAELFQLQAVEWVDEPTA